MTLQTHFNRQALPSAGAFYATEFGSALRGRPSRQGWVAVRCVFHQSSNPRSRSLSINMHEGHFCCFSCGAKGGDVLAFVMQRDGLDFKRAAQSLGAWLEAPTPADVREMEKRKRERERIRAEEETRKENERQNRILCREVLHRCEADYRKAVRDVDWDLMAELLPSVRTLANRYRELAGLEPE